MPACDPEGVLERKMTRHLVNPNLRKVGTAGAAVPESAELWRTYVADMDRQIALMFPDGTTSAAPRPADRPTATVAI